jgi:IclR family acetate operon transcriptional repressor
LAEYFESHYGIASMAAAPVCTADGTLAAIIGITGPVDALTDAQMAHLIRRRGA